MNDAERLAHRLYSAFQKLDYMEMARCYSSESFFQDPAFTLEQGRVCAMWHMLCERAQDFSLQYEITGSSSEHAQVFWQADYLFSQTGRKVHNEINASIDLKAGKIIRHIDTFDFWKWSRQAIGPAGAALGWSNLLKNKVGQTAMRSLAHFEKHHPCDYFADQS